MMQSEIAVTTQATMKAVRMHTYGGPEVLVYEDAPKPQAGEGEVLVRVRAVSVNPHDWKVRSHSMNVHNYQLPLILGWDIAGDVETVGAGVSDISEGEAIYAYANADRNGGYAEYIALQADELARKPASVDYVTAASIPIAALTAWQGLFEQGNLTGGQRVLIHAASGSVGSFAVQFAKQKGAYVVGTASARNTDFVLGLGADRVIDYNTTQFEDVAKDIDLVLDLIGGETRQRSLQTLKRDGILVSVLSEHDPLSTDTLAKYGVQGKTFFVKPIGVQLIEIARLVDAGYIKTNVGTVLPLSAASEAHKLSQTGRVFGKIVLRVD